MVCLFLFLFVSSNDSTDSGSHRYVEQSVLSAGCPGFPLSFAPVGSNPVSEDGCVRCHVCNCKSIQHLVADASWSALSHWLSRDLRWSLVWNPTYRTCLVFKIRDRGGCDSTGSSITIVPTPHIEEYSDKQSFASRPRTEPRAPDCWVCGKLGPESGLKSFCVWPA